MEIKTKAIEILSKRVTECNMDAVETVEYLFSCGLISTGAMRIALIKDFVESEIRSGLGVMQARQNAAEKYCMSVENVEKMFFRPEYSEIKFV